MPAPDKPADPTPPTKPAEPPPRPMKVRGSDGSVREVFVRPLNREDLKARLGGRA